MRGYFGVISIMRKTDKTEAVKFIRLSGICKNRFLSWKRETGLIAQSYEHPPNVNVIVIH